MLRTLRGAMNLVMVSVMGCLLCIGQTQKASLSGAEIYKKSSPAVVLIDLYDLKGQVSKQGSGFLVSPDGKILTNYHVIAHSKQATVRLANGDAYDTVDVIDIDKRKDIALIKIKAVDQPYLTLGRSASVQIGDTVFSLSNPLGVLQNTLSQGIVSGIRQGDGYRYFQISAPISPGSSGGPIFDSNGQVVGIAVLTIEGGQNLNFAVPIDYAKGLLTSNMSRPLASIYEPETESAKSGGTTASETASPSIPDQMKQDSIGYLESKIGKWTADDAKVLLGESIRYRQYQQAGGVPPADIYAYEDPTKAFRQFELAFDGVTKKLSGVYAYPWNLTWVQCRQLWGNDVNVIKNHDGTRVYSYRNRRLNVFVQKDGTVISIGVY